MCFTLFIVLSKMHNKFFNISIVRVDEASYGLPWVRKFVFTDKLFTLIKETFTLMLLNPPINSSEHRICQVDTNVCRKQK